MYATERHQAILAAARANGRVEVKALSVELDVTPETIRRDLTILERHGHVRRVHGGAIPMERLEIEPGVSDREGRQAAQKERIARTALEELPESGAILIDAGTTAVRLAKLLPSDREFTVITHALQVAMQLALRGNINLHLLGGTIRDRTLAGVGPWCENALGDVYADIAFLGTNGLTVERGLTTPDLAEARVKRGLIKASRRTVVLADHTKFGRADFAHVAPLSAVDTIITGVELSESDVDQVAATGPRVIRA